MCVARDSNVTVANAATISQSVKSHNNAQLRAYRTDRRTGSVLTTVPAASECRKAHPARLGSTIELEAGTGKQLNPDLVLLSREAARASGTGRRPDGHPVATASTTSSLVGTSRTIGIVSGQRSAVSGQRSAVSGQRSAVSGQQSAISNQQSAISSQQSAVSSQQSAVSGQRSAVSGQRSAVSSQQSAVSNQQSAISNQQSAISNQQSAISHQPSAKKCVGLSGKSG